MYSDKSLKETPWRFRWCFFMLYIKKYILILSRLTPFKKWLVFCSLALLKINTPIVSRRRALPMAKKKGIITLTLVISRVSIKAPVMRSFCVMKLNFFRIKTKLEYQIEEYLNWKSQFSEFTATAHKDVLHNFVRQFNYKDVSEIVLPNIQTFYEQTVQTRTTFSAIKSMEAIRGFMSYCWNKKQHSINPKQICNTGIRLLQAVVKNDIILPIKRKKRVGRPINVAFIKEVKIMKDKAGLGFQEIANIYKERGILKTANRGYIYRAFHKDLSKLVA